jgi:hypothetical protein
MSYAKSSNDTSRDRARSEAAQTPETDVGRKNGGRDAEEMAKILSVMYLSFSPGKSAPEAGFR